MPKLTILRLFYSLLASFYKNNKRNTSSVLVISIDLIMGI